MNEYLNTPFIYMVNETIHKKRDREIIIERFVDGVTLEKLAEKYDLSTRQIRRIVKKADPILIKLL